MTRSELIQKLADKNQQLTKADVEASVALILDSIAKALSEGNRVEVRGFGVFGLNYRPPRLGRNPKSGEKVAVPEKYAPHFKVGRELRERVNAQAN